MYEDLRIQQLAALIDKEWANVYFGARPYLDAMYHMNSINDNYGLDSGKSVVTYFLANAQHWRGPIARDVKAELKRRIK